jgi:hypothetical protein
MDQAYHYHVTLKINVAWRSTIRSVERNAPGVAHLWRKNAPEVDSFYLVAAAPPADQPQLNPSDYAANAIEPKKSMNSMRDLKADGPFD